MLHQSYFSLVLIPDVLENLQEVPPHSVADFPIQHLEQV